MKNHLVLRASVLAAFLIFCLLPIAAHATTSCTAIVGINFYSSINDALAALGAGPGVIFVTGTCTESVQINNVRSVTIDGFSGAAVVGPLDSDAFDISQSQNIVLGDMDIGGTFSTTGNGGGAGVVVTEASDVHIVRCHIHDNQVVGVDADTGSQLFLRDTIIERNTPFDGLDVYDNSTVGVVGSTIQFNGSLGTGGTAGVFVARDSVIRFGGGGETNYVQYNADLGIEVRNLSNAVFGAGGVTIQGNGTTGVSVETGSHLQVNGPKTIIQGNGAACPADPTCGGISATQDSTVTLDVGTVSGNQGSGISAQQGASITVGAPTPSLGTATVTNNSGDGVHIQWLSSAKINSGNTITGNGGASISCDDDSLAIGDLSVYTKVRCAEVESPSGHEHEDKDNRR